MHAKQAELDKAIAATRLSETQYKEQLIKYAVGITAAELAVIGFLLQSAVAKEIISSQSNKALLIISLIFSSITVILCMLEAKFVALYHKSYSYFVQAKIFASDIDVNVAPFDVVLTQEMIEEFASQQASYAKRLALYDRLKQHISICAEISFGLSILFAVIFVVHLVVSI